MNLSDVARPVQQHLAEFEGIFRNSMRSNIGLVDVVTRYILRQKGKKVRPILVLLSAGLCGAINEKSYRGATLVEILHTATLIHDDVVDDADTRRGLASINAVWKNKIAVLMGDFLLSKGLLLSLDHGDVRFLHITSRAVQRMSEGELHQIQRSRKLDMDEQAYLAIIGDKTASLLSTCCEIGAVSATEDPSLHTVMKDYGELVGMAFQIRDDLLDYVGKKTITGKPSGLDLTDRKLTLPLVHALQQAPQQEREEILGMIRKGGKRLDVRRVASFAEERGGLAYAEMRARDYARQAIERLSCFPASDFKTALELFARFVVERTH